MSYWKEQLVRLGMSESSAACFIDYHDKHRFIWQAFEQEALRLIENGARRLGSKAIFEKLRQDPSIQKIGEFKVHNSYTPHYARIFCIKYPHHADKFVLKACS